MTTLSFNLPLSPRQRYFFEFWPWISISSQDLSWGNNALLMMARISDDFFPLMLCVIRRFFIWYSFTSSHLVGRSNSNFGVAFPIFHSEEETPFRLRGPILVRFWNFDSSTVLSRTHFNSSACFTVSFPKWTN